MLDTRNGVIYLIAVCTQTSAFPTDNIITAEPKLVVDFPTKACCFDCTLKATLIDLRCRSNFWESRHKDALVREKSLKADNEKLQARITYLERQLYSQKSEQHCNTEATKQDSKPKRNRGHQPGNKGHKRRDYSNLPTQEVMLTLAADACVCQSCGLPFSKFPTTEDSETIVIEVQAYRRVYRRQRYTPSCKCPGNKGIITAPAAPRLIPKSKLDVSLWVHLLVEKYLFQRPLNRALASLSGYGVTLASGTVCDGLGRLGPLFEPITKEIHEKSLQEKWWHADETRWVVMEVTEGKLTYRWYIWVFVSPSTVVHVLAPGRGSNVVGDFFGEVKNGILCVDRYSAYKCFVKTLDGFVLAFCWVHVRRDFLDIGKSWPKLEAWSLAWVNSIGKLFHLNKQRIQHPVGSQEFIAADKLLRQAVIDMETQLNTQLKQPALHTICRKRLESMSNHWNGLTVFVDHPHIPMDNSAAERALRNDAVGRKNYYGSGSKQSGHFTVALFTIFQTLLLWNINPRTWLTEYLEKCARLGGKPPEDSAAFLPWNMSTEKLTHYRNQPFTTIRSP